MNGQRLRDRLTAGKRLAKKAYRVLTEDGVVPFAKKSFAFGRYHTIMLKNRAVAALLPPERVFRDVLFINGCSLPHPTRYRVDHQIEQLGLAGVSATEVYYEDVELTLELVKYHHALVLFRCPYTDQIGKLIAAAKALNKAVLFDIDDLVIDERYVKQIKHLSTMTPADYAGYMDGVRRNGQTLALCDAAMTTTEALAGELQHFVPRVHINRNVASEEMVKVAQLATARVAQPSVPVLGYFSGSITHNDDFLMIAPVLAKLMDERRDLRLLVVGHLDLPPALVRFASRIRTQPFGDWRELPELIRGATINLVPLQDSLFNAAKSEIKWIEAALVRVPTVASNVGAFAKMVRHGETGLLCRTEADWYVELSKLLDSRSECERLAANAHQDVIERCTSVRSAQALASLIRSELKPSFAFVLPTTNISGGVNVVSKHAEMLQAAGHDVTVLSEAPSDDDLELAGGRVPVVSLRKTTMQGSFDRAVATLWSTLAFVESYPHLRERFYLVQNFETDFYQYGDPLRALANSTYSGQHAVGYLTISRWCQDWLHAKYGQTARYAPNGLDLDVFSAVERSFDGKIRVLVEGNSNDHYKNVDESFHVANALDRGRYEVWYLSYAGEPKPWYKVDKFFHKVPYREVSSIYKQCHVLLKSSLVESFSYPPLEMMATGGFVVVVPNGGNAEYLEDGKNCLLYERGNHDDARAKIEAIVGDAKLRAWLFAGGLATAQARQWSKIRPQVLKLYGVSPRPASVARPVAIGINAIGEVAE